MKEGYTFLKQTDNLPVLAQSFPLRQNPLFFFFFFSSIFPSLADQGFASFRFLRDEEGQTQDLQFLPDLLIFLFPVGGCSAELYIHLIPTPYEGSFLLSLWLTRSALVLRERESAAKQKEGEKY